MSKYNNRKVEADGYTFDSQAEYYRYCELLLLARSGQISHLEVHPKFELLPAFKDASGKHHRKIEYEADFRYTEAGRKIVEDKKGVRTAVFKIKEKLLLNRYRDIEFRIVEV